MTDRTLVSTSQYLFVFSVHDFFHDFFIEDYPKSWLWRITRDLSHVSFLMMVYCTPVIIIWVRSSLQREPISHGEDPARIYQAAIRFPRPLWHLQEIALSSSCLIHWLLL